MSDFIRIRGARQHNLKNINVDIPKGSYVVITGPSGSGKSSLAFHTLFAEGQRRYVESLSLRMRQHMKQLEKPDVDRIEGLSPTIAIEQAVPRGGVKSTVATSTEIYDYLCVLYAAQGVPHDPVTGAPLKKLTSEDIIECVMQFEEGTRCMLLAPLSQNLYSDRPFLLTDLQRQGFVRIRVNGELKELGSERDSWAEEVDSMEVVVDRLVVREQSRSRFADSLETALRVSPSEILVLSQKSGDQEWEESRFCTSYRNVETGFELNAIKPKNFSFQSLAGACHQCRGSGEVERLTMDRVVPDQGKSIRDGAFDELLKASGRKKAFLSRELSVYLKKAKLDQVTPVSLLGERFGFALFDGDADLDFDGLEKLFSEWKQQNSFPAKLAKMYEVKVCDFCGGDRLKPEYQAVRLNFGKGADDWLGIQDFCKLPVEHALNKLKSLEIDQEWNEVLRDIVGDALKQLTFLKQLGLSYLQLNRLTDTLSGGEAQRVRLSAHLGGGLSDVIYILDEPSIGLHPSDNEKLLSALLDLKEQGNSVIVVEHDEDLMRQADWVIDIGPEAGLAGGEILAEGDFEAIRENENSITGKWLKKALGNESAESTVAESHLKIQKASVHNLDDVDLKLPLHKIVCLSGVSGSGKSTLLQEVLIPSLQSCLLRKQGIDFNLTNCESLSGYESIKQLIVVDQKPIGRSPRSNPATFTGSFDELRKLFAMVPESKKRGYTSSRFSFNLVGGRCEKCQGSGQMQVDLQFLKDAFVLCPACQGKRFNRETLEVSYKGRTMADVLAMSFDEALELFARVPKLKRIFGACVELGLGYLTLGQSALTLSGGEAQRLKLAAELAKKSSDHTLFILDEPTTGLHLSDVEVLLKGLRKLRDAGHSLVVIEHHLDVLQASDWIIDLGPGGGEHGGEILFSGSPVQLAKQQNSLTGRFLAQKISY